MMNQAIPATRTPAARPSWSSIELGSVAPNEHGTNWLLALMATVVVLTLHVSFLVSLVWGIGEHPIRFGLRLAVTLFVAGCLTLLVLRRHSPTAALCGGVFTAAVAPFLLTFWINEEYFALLGRLGMTWDLFLGPKLMMFVIAALCPTAPTWLAPLLFAAFAGEQIAMWFAFDLGSPTAHLATREPWLSVACTALAGVLLGGRITHTKREHEIALIRADASVLRRTNEAFLAVQDMANTPIQNLELALALLEERQQGDPLVHAAQRAVVRLRELSQLLPVDGTTEAAVDAGSLERVRQLQTSRG